MSSTSIIITAQSTTGAKKQKTVTNVNPAATDAALLSFAQLYNSLSTHIYTQTDRVDKINLDTESSQKTARALTITANASSNTVADWKYQYSTASGIRLTVTDNDNSYSGEYGFSTGATGLFINSATIGTRAAYISNIADLDAGTITVYAPETDNYTAGVGTLTITKE